MGMFGGNKPGGGFDWKAAAIAFANPEAGAMYANRRDKQAKAETEMAAEVQARSVAMKALTGMGLSPDIASVIASDPDQRARYLADESGTKQFGATGGSLARRNPVTGVVEETYRAPWQEQVGETIIRGGANGAAPETIYQGVRPVPVPGKGVYGMTGDGRIIGANSGYNPYNPTAPMPSPTAPADDDEWDYGTPAQGGAGPQTPRPFRGAFNPYIRR